MDHIAFSRKGGKARSPAKTAANRAKAAAYWGAVRAGERSAPRRGPRPPDPADTGGRLARCCRRHGIVLLEAFGPYARGGCARGCPADLLATFSAGPGPGVPPAAGELSEVLGEPVRLLARDALEKLANPFRRAAILADATVIFRGA